MREALDLENRLRVPKKQKNRLRSLAGHYCVTLSGESF
jgi:hypothetical protein